MVVRRGAFLERMVIAAVIGFGGSCALFDMLHKPGAPELARYGSGGVLIVRGAYVLFREEAALQTLATVALVGTGTALNRLRMVLQ